MFAATFFAQTRQVPSLLTMQAPTGLAGVQAFMNMGHSLGLIFPMITRWHSQPSSDVFALLHVDSEFFSSVKLFE